MAWHIFSYNCFLFQLYTSTGLYIQYTPLPPLHDWYVTHTLGQHAIVLRIDHNHDHCWTVKTRKTFTIFYIRMATNKRRVANNTVVCSANEQVCDIKQLISM
jgi:hypothetical protein